MFFVGFCIWKVLLLQCVFATAAYIFSTGLGIVLTLYMFTKVSRTMLF